MYTVLILFFASLLAIVAMIGYKVSLARNGTLMMKRNLEVNIPEFHQINNFTKRGLRRYGFIFLVIVIKIYVKFTYFLKNRLGDVKSFIVRLMQQKRGLKEGKKEVSGFLKMVAEYKSKIKSIKYRIVIEEELNQ